MPKLALAVEIADACRDPDMIGDLEAVAKQLHKSHPEADVDTKNVVAAMRSVAGESTLRSADEKASFVPVTVRFRQSVQQIASLREALQFLRHWPSDRQGPTFICAERSCHAAAAGDMPVEQARQSFESFANIVGILAESSRRPELNDGVLSSECLDGRTTASSKKDEAERSSANLVKHYLPIGPAAIAAALAASKKRKPKSPTAPN